MHCDIQNSSNKKKQLAGPFSAHFLSSHKKTLENSIGGVIWSKNPSYHEDRKPENYISLSNFSIQKPQLGLSTRIGGNFSRIRSISSPNSILKL